MTIAKDLVVSFKYTLTNDQGETLDESGDSPLVYLHGHQNIVPGLEKVLEGLAVGSKAKAKVSPEEGYGVYDQALKFDVSIDKFGGDIPPLEALMEVSDKDGDEFVARVVEVTKDHVTLDANHPLAGQTLNFDVEITEIRAAEPDELSHGHVHGEGCHHH